MLVPRGLVLIVKDCKGSACQAASHHFLGKHAKLSSLPAPSSGPWSADDQGNLAPFCVHKDEDVDEDKDEEEDRVFFFLWSPSSGRHRCQPLVLDMVDLEDRNQNIFEIIY